MEADRTELTMRVEGMACAGCGEAVARAIRRLDPGAAVEVDRTSGRVRARTGAQSRDSAQALDRAGCAATAMTG